MYMYIHVHLFSYAYNACAYNWPTCIYVPLNVLNVQEYWALMYVMIIALITAKYTHGMYVHIA